MHNREGEVIVRIVKRHTTPFILNIIKVLIVVVPVYFFLYIVADSFGPDVLIGTLSIFTFIVIIAFLIGSLDYLLDKLIITNFRVICVDWKSLLKKEEEEVEISEIQDIKTSQFGILGKLRIFNYGTLEVESSASRVSVVFRYCSDPELVKRLMFAQMTHKRNHLPNDLA